MEIIPWGFDRAILAAAIQFLGVSVEQCGEWL
jgi:hypothetical protein